MLYFPFSEATPARKQPIWQGTTRPSEAAGAAQPPKTQGGGRRPRPPTTGKAGHNGRAGRPQPARHQGGQVKGESAGGRGPQPQARTRAGAALDLVEHSDKLTAAGSGIAPRHCPFRARETPSSYRLGRCPRKVKPSVFVPAAQQRARYAGSRRAPQGSRAASSLIERCRLPWATGTGCRGSGQRQGGAAQQLPLVSVGKVAWRVAVGQSQGDQAE